MLRASSLTARHHFNIRAQTMRVRIVTSWPFTLLVGLLVLGAVVEAQPYDSTMFRAFAWRNLPATRGGRVTTAVGVPGNPRVYYMGAAGGGVWKTENASAT